MSKDDDQHTMPTIVARPSTGVGAPPGKAPAPSPRPRSLLSGAAAAVVAASLAAVPAPAVAEPAGADAEIVRLADSIMTNAAAVTHLGEEGNALPYPEAWRFHEQKVRPLMADSWAMRMRMARMQATTPDGFRAKARVLQDYRNCSLGYAELDLYDALGWSLANDLLGAPSVWKADREGEDET